MPTDDGVAVGTLSQDEEGRELFAELGNSTAGSDTTGVSIEEIILDCTDETLWLPSAPIGEDYSFRRVEAFIWTLRTSLATRLIPEDAQASRSQQTSLTQLYQTNRLMSIKPNLGVRQSLSARGHPSRRLPGVHFRQKNGRDAHLHQRPDRESSWSVGTRLRSVPLVATPRSIV